MRSKRGDAHRDGRLDVTSEGVDMSINIIKCGGNAGGRGEGGKMKTKLVPISFRKKGDGTSKKGPGKEWKELELKEKRIGK